VVQDLILRSHVVRYRRRRWLTADGHMVVAPLPAGIAGHFGPELRRFVLAQYHRGQVTVPRLVGLLRDIGVDISERQVVRLLSASKEDFLAEASDVLRAGLETARWITVDDTGARHRGRNRVCTQIGNHHFAWFATTGSKSRLNFVGLLRAGHGDYVVNQAALAYMRGRHLSGPVIARLAEHESKRFADRAAWTAHLEGIGITALKVHPDPVRIATEGALWGSVTDHGLLANAVIISDDAGQFNVGRHALCWVHAESHRADQGAGVVVLRRPQDLLPRPHPGRQASARQALRSHFLDPDRVRNSRSVADAVARQQGRVADGAGAARHPAPHQWLGERHPLPGHPAQDQRGHTLGCRPRLPRRLPRADEDMRQARRRLLELPRRPPQRPRCTMRPVSPRTDPTPSRCLIARTFAG